MTTQPTPEPSEPAGELKEPTESGGNQWVAGDVVKSPRSDSHYRVERLLGAFFVATSITSEELGVKPLEFTFLQSEFHLCCAKCRKPGLRLCAACEKTKPSYYIASRTKHARSWRANRDGGDRITSTWIDEAGEGESSSYEELAIRCLEDIKRADFLLLFCEPGEILKGALIEAGMALALGKPVRCVGDYPQISRVFKKHPLWSTWPSVSEAASAPPLKPLTPSAPSPERQYYAMVDLRRNKKLAEDLKRRTEK